MQPSDFYNTKERNRNKRKLIDCPKKNRASRNGYKRNINFMSISEKSKPSNNSVKIEPDECIVLSSDESIISLPVNSDHVRSRSILKNNKINEKGNLKVTSKLIIMGSGSNFKPCHVTFDSNNLNFELYINGAKTDIKINFLRVSHISVTQGSDYLSLLLKLRRKYKPPKGVLFDSTVRFRGVIIVIDGEKITVPELLDKLTCLKFAYSETLENNQLLYILSSALKHKWPRELVIVYGDFLKNSTYVLLGYSSNSSLNLIQITIADLYTLRPDGFVNDTIVQFYLDFLMNEVIPEDKRKDIYIFNTYFYNKIKLCRDYSSDLLKWTKNVNIFNKQFVFLPVNNNVHWSVFIIINLPCFSELYGSVHKDGKFLRLRPYIIAFDSLKMLTFDNPIFEDIRQYVAWMWKQYHPKSSLDFTSVNLPCLTAKVMSQKNYCDCGLFLLQYVESLFDRIPNIDNQQDCYLDLFRRDKIGRKRRDITDLILQKANQYSNFRRSS